LRMYAAPIRVRKAPSVRDIAGAVQRVQRKARASENACRLLRVVCAPRVGAVRCAPVR